VVAHIDKQYAAMIAPVVDPSGDFDLFADITFPQFAAIVRTIKAHSKSLLNDGELLAQENTFWRVATMDRSEKGLYGSLYLVVLFASSVTYLQMGNVIPAIALSACASTLVPFGR
jgi:hypothetical protein